MRSILASDVSFMDMSVGYYCDAASNMCSVCLLQEEDFVDVLL